MTKTVAVKTVAVETPPPTDQAEPDQTVVTPDSARAAKSSKPERPRPRPTWTRWLRLLPALAVLVLAIVGPWVVPFNPERVAGAPLLSPSGKFWFGTDDNGLDVFSQTLAGARYDVLIAVCVVLVATIVGVALGLAIGMNESRRGPIGWLARLVSRIVDFIQAVPAMLFGLIAVAFFGASATSLTLIVAAILAPFQVRLVRTEVLQVRGEGYIDAARMAGTGELKLTLRHVLPNSARPATLYMSVLFGVSVILVASLGFIGVGLPPPTPEWGSMVSKGATDVSLGRWWPAAFPLIFLVLTVSAVAFGFTALDRRRVRR